MKPVITTLEIENLPAAGLQDGTGQGSEGATQSEHLGSDQALWP